MAGPATPELHRLRHLPRVILVTGLVSAAVLYFIASPKPENPLGYEPLQTKRYVHDLQMYGGKANVLAAELREWFAGLWYGRNLGVTVAVLSVLAALLARFVLTPVAPPEGPDEEPYPRLVR